MISLKSLFVIAGCWIALAITFLLMVIVYIPTWNWSWDNSVAKLTDKVNTTEEYSTDGTDSISYYPFPEPMLLSSYFNIKDQPQVTSDVTDQDSESSGRDQSLSDFKDFDKQNEDQPPKTNLEIKWEKYLNLKNSSKLIQTNNLNDVEIPKEKQGTIKKKAYDYSSYSSEEVDSVLEKLLANDILKTYDELTSEEDNDSNDDTEESSDDSIYSILKSHAVFSSGFLKSVDNQTSENEIESNESNEIEPSVPLGLETASNTLENLYDYTPDEHVDITKAISPLDNLEPESEEDTDRKSHYDEQKSLMLGALFSALQQADTKEAAHLPCSGIKKTSMKKQPKQELEIRISRVDFISDEDDDATDDDTVENEDDDDDTNYSELLISKVQAVEMLGELYSFLVYLMICVCSLLVIFICIIIFANMALRHFETDLLEFIKKGANKSSEIQKIPKPIETV